MHVTTAMYAIGLAGVFPSRAFLPAFATAMLVRFGPQIPALQNSKLLQTIDLTSVPAWLTSDYTLIALGILSVLELVATKSADVRVFMLEVDKYFKSVVAFLTINAVLDANDRRVLDSVQQAGVISASLGLVAAALVFGISWLREGAYALLMEADEHDDLGIQKVLSWLEELWTVFGLLLVVFFPLLMLLCVALITGGLYLIKRYKEHREESSKIACPGCGQLRYPSALQCSKCHAAVSQPAAVGFFGQPLSTPAADRKAHALSLVEKKRCPVCAAHLHVRSVRQACPECGHQLMQEPAFAADYLAHVEARLPRVLTICLVLSLMPVLGLIAGIVYFRLTLIAPFRRYIPFHIGCLVKWAVRLMNCLLMFVQLVPIVGGVVVPLMAYVNYRVYRSVYQKELRRSPPAPAIAAVPPQ